MKPTLGSIIQPFFRGEEASSLPPTAPLIEPPITMEPDLVKRVATLTNRIALLPGKKYSNYQKESPIILIGSIRTSYRGREGLPNSTKYMLTTSSK